MFSKKPDQPELPRNRRMGDSGMGKSSTFSVIGGDVVIHGNITASTELHVDGRIDGDIGCASLVQGEASMIEGAVTAETARLAGALNGSITARELVILKTARIQGDVHYEALTIEQGAVVEGKFAPNGMTRSASNNAETGPATDGGEPKLTLAT